VPALQLFLLICGKAYGSAVSLPSNATGIAVFDNIGLFDLPDGAIFQVFYRDLFLFCWRGWFHCCIRLSLRLPQVSQGPCGATKQSFPLLVRVFELLVWCSIIFNFNT